MLHYSFVSVLHTVNSSCGENNRIVVTGIKPCSFCSQSHNTDDKLLFLLVVECCFAATVVEWKGFKSDFFFASNCWFLEIILSDNIEKVSSFQLQGGREFNHCWNFDRLVYY
ncbi:hypothetical protein ILUMI_10881 [Ignelater luminosus]|uniref:Uncharacterized protein n=1 Tax=Ignelater luminosus TaxID=2038154 RepID=A0A8K0D2G1_IGNLU|nr:hypothetical protein ILUMI_10881 [Ignelater luminosus]